MDILLRLVLWNFAMGVVARYAADRFRPFLRWAAPLAVLGLPLATAPERLAATSVFLLFALKGSLLLGRERGYVERMDPLGLVLYFSLWPGMDPAPLQRRLPEVEFPASWFVRGWVTMIVSAVLVGWLALTGRLTGWWLLAGVLSFVHLGYADVLSALVRLLGFAVPRLFDEPLASVGLREFWSRRWNRPFVEMNQLLWLPLLGRLGVSRSQGLLAAFLLSGLLHEAAISFPAESGWGGPLAYFVLQAMLIRLEGSWMDPLPTWVRRLWTWTWLFLPLPLLFHASFHRAFLEPLAGALRAFPLFSEPALLVRFLLTTAGWGHFLVMAAGLQVPWRLGWLEELTRLRPLNRKLLWVYYGYIGSFIVTFGVVILRLREEMLAGERGACALLTIIAVFWTARILIDAAVFEHDDWPEGVLFTIGHTLLTSLFIFIALSCWLVLSARVWAFVC